jgi:multidrug efflux system membrane fusion protein
MSGVKDQSDVYHMSRDHQLSPPVFWYGKRWILWTSLLLLLLLVAIITAIAHNNAVKAAAAKRALAAAKPSVTATAATAAKGDIGIYLDAIGTVTPVYTTSVMPPADGVLTAVHYSEG